MIRLYVKVPYIIIIIIITIIIIIIIIIIICLKTYNTVQTND